MSTERSIDIQRPADEDPNVRQRRAADPQASVWVGASAGTGKTKVLTDRVLRLLLPRDDGEAGTAPERILCLTFTKAGAGEMSLRLQKTLSEWAVMSDDKLTEKLKGLTGQPPDEHLKKAARRLFAQVVDTAGGLKIMTIHAFCQSVLGRFPVEAGISPQLNIIEDSEAALLQRRALQNVIADPEFAPLYERLIVDQYEGALQGLISQMMGERAQLENFFTNYQDEDAQQNILRHVLNAPDLTKDEIIAAFFARIDKTRLKDCADTLAQGGKNDKLAADLIHDWLAAPQETVTGFYALRSGFFTTGGTPRKISKKPKEVWDGLETAHGDICAAIEETDEALKAANAVQKTHDLLALGHAMVTTYDKYKAQRAVLDYTDLILKVHHLLHKNADAAQWVLFKLDGGLEHLLIDEAQDTNPEQWDLIKKLSEDFFSGEGRTDSRVRTIFSVGDEKQSIYRFQRAAPEKFHEMRQDFEIKVENARQIWRDVLLNMSFRSTRTVLQFVDAAFAPSAMAQEVGLAPGESVQHKSWRRRHAGRVELWPPVPKQEPVNREPWQMPTEIVTATSSSAILAAQVAQTISTWIAEGEMLESKGRPIRPGDILVLMRSRSAFVGQLTQALKTNGVPVSGADRLNVAEHIGVQDVMAAMQFALQPEDNLTLACLLKSPFVGLNEEQLFDLSYGRGKTPLYKKVQQSEYKVAANWLSALVAMASSAPCVVVRSLLYTPCPADRVSGLRALRRRLGNDVLDPLNEFMNIVGTFEQQHTPSLQQFMIWQAGQNTEIKREMEEGSGQVRIMTVHGAKGLQAPIVFLPDTLQVSQSKAARLLWPDRTGEEAPVWSARKGDDPSSYTAIFDKIETQERAEYKRLFYVAATRAEDRLIICGAEKGTKASEESWYYYAQNAFDHLKDEVLNDPHPADPDQTIRYIYHPQDPMADIEPSKDHKDTHNARADLPAWLYKPAPEEPDPPRPLQPSRPSESDPPALSPLAAAEDYRFLRGNLTHTLLQFLPDVAEGQRSDKAHIYLKQYGEELPEATRNEIAQEVQDILNDPAFAPVFGAGSQAEVSVSGYLPSGRLISGQIDRLLITDTEILIVDYKSNRPPPLAVADVPKQYLNQMRAYRETMAEIYPQHNIRIALLWTDGCRLMEVE